MVGGADKLCSYLADGKQTVRVMSLQANILFSSQVMVS